MRYLNEFLILEFVAKCASGYDNMLSLARTLRGATQAVRWQQTASNKLAYKVHLTCMRSSASSVIDSAIHEDFFGEDYFRSLQLSDEKLCEALTNPARFQSIDTREDRTDVTYHSVGRYLSKYRGAFMVKNPNDLSVYYQLFTHVRPRVVFEMGTFTGASAMWYDDTAKSLELHCHIYSVDIEPQLLNEELKQIKPDTVHYITGDTAKIEDIFPTSMLEPLPHPWLIVEDSHDNSERIAEHFHQFMRIGDYLVIEDTSPDMRLGDSSKRASVKWGVEKLNAVKDLLRSPVGQHFKVDSFFTDLYGYNCTWHWHGFLRKCS